MTKQLANKTYTERKVFKWASKDSTLFQNRTMLLNSRGNQANVFIVTCFIAAVLDFTYATLNANLQGDSQYGQYAIILVVSSISFKEVFKPNCGPC